MMRRFFAIAASAAALVATPVFGGEWEMELDIDRVTEFHTLEIVNATCVIGWNGDSLYLAVGKDGRFLHQGWFMQNGQTPPGVPSVRGNPIAAFRMSGCASRIIDI